MRAKVKLDPKRSRRFFEVLRVQVNREHYRRQRCLASLFG